MNKILAFLLVILFVLTGCHKEKDENEIIMEGFDKDSAKKNVLLEKPLGAETFSEGIKVAPRTLCAEYLKRPWEIGGAKENISDAVNSQVPVHMFIRFEEEDVYHMGYLDRPYDDIVGFYEMGGNTVKLRPPVNKNFPLYNLMFPAGTEQVLIYNFDYPDFYDAGVLYNDNIVLRSHFNIRNKESSEKLILDGVEVFAEAEKNITVSENMGLRSRPSVQEGKIKSFDYAYSLFNALNHPYNTYDEEGRGNLFNNSVNSENTKCELLLKGQSARIIARTVKEDTIGGETGPWYYVTLQEQADTPYYLNPGYWIFGGSCEFQSADNKELDLLAEAEKRSMLLPGREKSFTVDPYDEEPMTLLAARDPGFEVSWSDFRKDLRNSPDMKYNEYLYFKNGNTDNGSTYVHVTNEFLGKVDIKVKLGMTKDQVTEAWGEPHGMYGNCWYYCMNYEGHGFEITLTWDYNKLKTLSYEHWK